MELPLSIGPIYFEFKGCWVVSFKSIQILKVHFVKQKQTVHNLIRRRVVDVS